jgi:hypothetical protein
MIGHCDGSKVRIAHEVVLVSKWLALGLQNLSFAFVSVAIRDYYYYSLEV